MKTEREIYAILTELFQELFADDDIVLTAATTANDIKGWDSFNYMNIIIAVEIRFSVRMHSSEIEGLKSVGDLVAMILAKTGGQ